MQMKVHGRISRYYAGDNQTQAPHSKKYNRFAIAFCEPMSVQPSNPFENKKK